MDEHESTQPNRVSERRIARTRFDPESSNTMQIVLERYFLERWSERRQKSATQTSRPFRGPNKSGRTKSTGQRAPLFLAFQFFLSSHISNRPKHPLWTSFSSFGIMYTIALLVLLCLVPSKGVNALYCVDDSMCPHACVSHRKNNNNKLWNMKPSFQRFLFRLPISPTKLTPFFAL